MTRVLLVVASRVHVALFRWSRGRLGGRLGKNQPVLLLTTTGRKSGKPRTTPLLYVEDGDRYIVVASVGGAPKHPAWYLNLREDARATIEVGGRSLAVRAETAEPEERARLWQALTRMYPTYDAYQARTTRTIPVVALTPC
ncbi:MAG TPA: nitroreductase family deazaflavin-dependent oxidoreductase [Gaiellaceae bacterium]|nr:nitroreductase family deazaflavin-dependent oxidoreductase [Gaiellaceae bacterium]